MDKPVTIVVDSRETRAGTATRLEAIPGVTVIRKELPSGDYIIGEGVAVERKAAADLVASIMDGRLFEQLAKMTIEHERVVVLVEGNVYETRSAISEVALDGALSYLSLLSGAQVIASPNVGATVRLLHRMAVHIQHGLGYQIPLRASKPKAPVALAQFLVEGLPGVGPTTAMALLERFGSPLAVFSASKTDLLAVKGVGPKTADVIRAALGHPPQ